MAEAAASDPTVFTDLPDEMLRHVLGCLYTSVAALRLPWEGSNPQNPESRDGEIR